MLLFCCYIEYDITTALEHFTNILVYICACFSFVVIITRWNPVVENGIVLKTGQHSLNFVYMSYLLLKLI